MRELIIYIATLAIAGIPAYLVSLAMDWYVVNIKKQTIDPYAEFRFSWLVVFIVFAFLFYIGITAAHSQMDKACGVSPDYIGAEYDDQISDLEFKRDSAEAEIQFLKELRNQ